MNKVKQWVILIVFVLISCVYNHFTSDDFNELELSNNRSIEITVEGAVEGEKNILYLEEETTIEHVLEQIKLAEGAAIECVNVNKELVHGDYFYIPYQEDILASLNTSNEEELTLISGIGPSTAQKIIEYRQEHSFSCIEDIMKITGIKEKKYLKYRRYLCI